MDYVSNFIVSQIMQTTSIGLVCRKVLQKGIDQWRRCRRMPLKGQLWRAIVYHKHFHKHYLKIFPHANEIQVWEREMLQVLTLGQFLSPCRKSSFLMACSRPPHRYGPETPAQFQATLPWKTPESEASSTGIWKLAQWAVPRWVPAVIGAPLPSS